MIEQRVNKRFRDKIGAIQFPWTALNYYNVCVCIRKWIALLLLSEFVSAIRSDQARAYSGLNSLILRVYF